MKTVISNIPGKVLMWVNTLLAWKVFLPRNCIFTLDRRRCWGRRLLRHNTSTVDFDPSPFLTGFFRRRQAKNVPKLFPVTKWNSHYHKEWTKNKFCGLNGCKRPKSELEGLLVGTYDSVPVCLSLKCDAKKIEITW